MKKLITLSAIFTLCILFALNVCATQDYIVWDFSDASVVEKWTPSTTTVLTVTKDGTIVSGEGDDINLSYDAKGEIQLNDYKYFAVVLANPSQSGFFQFYHWTSTSAGHPRLQTTLSAQTGVTTVAFDLSAGAPDTAHWDGAANTFRLDPIRGAEKRQVMVVYIGLFKDKAAYEAYAAEHPVNITTETDATLSQTTPTKTEDVVSDAAPLVWDMSDSAVSAKWKPSDTTNVTVTEKGTVVSGSGNDLNLCYSPEEGENIRLNNYKILAVGYSDYTVSGMMQFYFWTDASTGNPLFSCDVAAGASDVFKQNTAVNSNWNGNVRQLRIDPARGDADRSMTISFIGLFPDEESYKAYVGDDEPDKEDEPIIPYGQPAKIYNVGKRNAAFGIEGDGCVVDYEDSYAVVTAKVASGKTVSDPTVVLPAGFNGEKYPWMKIRLRNLTSATTFEMHFASEATGNQIDGSTVTHFPITANDGDFVEYIVNMRDANVKTAAEIAKKQLEGSVWTGKIASVRFDFMWFSEPSGQVPDGSRMYIDYAAFFATEEEAKAYTPDAATEVEQPLVDSGKAGPQWIFDKDFNIKSLDITGMALNREAGVVTATVTSHDPTIVFPMSERDAFDTSEFRYLAYRHKTVSEIATCGIFFTTNLISSFDDKTYSPFTIKKNGEWQNLILDLSDTAQFPKDVWHGTCNGIRLDPINGQDIGATIVIDRIGFFRTKTDAYNFLAQGGGEPDYSLGAVYTSPTYKATVRDGALYEGYKKEEYILSSGIVEGGASHADSVVARVNADGTQTIIPMSYTNASGYTTYFADKPGTYKLISNRKAYTDTAGHWGEGYINFVSDRTLFGGTSPTEFSPDMPMTRGMFITVLGRMHGVDTSKYDGNTGYGDVNATEYYAPYIQWAKEYGLMNGLSDVTFGAEDAIYRETMATVIAKYITAFDYNFKGYNAPVTFTDLAGCDEATVNAINAAAQAGIINGKGDNIFDPKGISTRAEVATVMERVIKSVLGVNSVVSPYSDEHFNRDRLRLAAWGVGKDFASRQTMQMLFDMGIDTVISDTSSASLEERDAAFNYADLMGMQVIINDFPNTPETLSSRYDVKAHVSAYAHHPSFAGHNIIDEPGSEGFGWLGDLCDYYMEQLPGKITFTNLLPLYANSAQLKYGANVAAIEYYESDPALYKKYCEAWLDNFNGGFICADIYPLNGRSGLNNRSTWTTYGDYCEAVNLVATTARERGVEFWCYLQTWGWTSSKRTPTESEFRWQCYTLLSYGAKGLLLWSVSGLEEEYPSIFNGADDKVQLSVYNDCAAVMSEMRKLSDTYIQYKNLGAFTMNCTSKTPWLKMSGEYKDFSILSETVSSEALLIGCFQKKDGTGYAFTVVNMTDLKDNKPATFKFKLAESLPVTLYDEATPVTLTADAEGYYVIELESTDGVFVTIG